MNKAMDLHTNAHIVLNGKIFKVVEKMHVKPGKWGAIIQTKLKSLDGVKTEHRFGVDEEVEIVRITQIPHQFSYKEKEMIVVMNLETYESVEINLSEIPKESVKLLEQFAAEEMELLVEFIDDEKIFNIILPTPLKTKVIYADAVVQGQTATSSYKNATIGKDLNIGVPTYITMGDEILVNLYSENGIEFLKRA